MLEVQSELTHITFGCGPLLSLRTWNSPPHRLQSPVHLFPLKSLGWLPWRLPPTLLLFVSSWLDLSETSLAGFQPRWQIFPHAGSPAVGQGRLGWVRRGHTPLSGTLSPGISQAQWVSCSETPLGLSIDDFCLDVIRNQTCWFLKFYYFSYIY